MKLMTLMIAMLVFSAIHVKAQEQDESRIKIVNTDRPGVLKLIHAIPTEEPVIVKFISDDKVVASDAIKGSFPKGLLKRYDVRKISGKDFHMEISHAGLVITYRIVPSKDRKTFTPYLEKTERTYEVLASRN
jgi:hypothetical protein